MADRHALAVFPLFHGTYYIKFCHYYIVGVHLAVRCIQKFSVCLLSLPIFVIPPDKDGLRLRIFWALRRFGDPGLGSYNWTCMEVQGEASTAFLSRYTA